MPRFHFYGSSQDTEINTKKRGHLISPQFTMGHKVLLLKGAI